MEYPAAGLNEMQQHDRTRTTPVPTGSRAEWPALEGLRRRYAEDRDLFSAHERARLRFLRWLVQRGRLVS